MLRLCLVFWKSEPQYAYKKHVCNFSSYTLNNIAEWFGRGCGYFLAGSRFYLTNSLFLSSERRQSPSNAEQLQAYKDNQAPLGID